MPRRKPSTRSPGTERVPKSAFAVAPVSTKKDSTLPVTRLNVTTPTVPSVVPDSVITGMPPQMTQSSRRTSIALQAALSRVFASSASTTRPSSNSKPSSETNKSLR